MDPAVLMVLFLPEPLMKRYFYTLFVAFLVCLAATGSALTQAQGREALTKAESLVQEYPNFQLAQRVYGDLRDEAQMRLKALRERPPSGAVPSEFLTLSPHSKHAITVDISCSRLYLFENRLTGLVLLADYDISVGKSGVEKNIEGDLRTPMGIYFITSNIDPKSLKDFYGSGALPIGARGGPTNASTGDEMAASGKYFLKELFNEISVF